jgi:hypothetical protein
MQLGVFCHPSERTALTFHYHWIGSYNHRRSHQGIDGACPADRFYGIAADVNEAVKQGRLAGGTSGDGGAGA